MSVLIETTLGDIVIDLYTKDRPRTCLNFLKLCKIKYYNYVQFYFIQQDFIAQSGDPTNSGQGGASVFEQLYGDQARFFEMELLPKKRHIKRGTVSMVNNGDNLHGSQFFITLAENLDYLDDKHTVFGEVKEGFDVLDKLNEVISDEENRPYRDVWITHTIILHDPYPDPKGLEISSQSPSPSPALLKYSRIGVDEEIDETGGKTQEEAREDAEDKEAKARAHILEMIGDLHHAEERPPENVLFVAHLNPVTTEDDLAIIFGRFGKIVSCEVIRDRKTGNSLQYAFIEFDRVEDCETAYFKMNNVLIDDRRIYVNFSQSVAKNANWRQQLGLTKKKQESNLPTKTEFERNRKMEGERKSDKYGKSGSRKRPFSRSMSRSTSRSPVRERKHRLHHQHRRHEDRYEKGKDRKEHRRYEERRQSPSPKYSSSSKHKKKH